MVRWTFSDGVIYFSAIFKCNYLSGYRTLRLAFCYIYLERKQEIHLSKWVLTDSSGAPGSIFKAGASVDLRIGAVKYYPAGGQPTFQSPYIGQIDEVRLYESALTGQQILNLYNNGTISGVNQLNTDMAIGIYPNPVSEFLEISCDEPIETAEVYNVIGEQVIFVKDQITKLNVATLANGLYTIQLKTIGGKTVVKKFTKQ